MFDILIVAIAVLLAFVVGVRVGYLRGVHDTCLRPKFVHKLLFGDGQIYERVKDETLRGQR